MEFDSRKKETEPMRRFAGFLFAITILLFSSSLAYSQGSAVLTGTVTDPQGAVVPGAKVTATNVATNVANDTQTNSEGNYRFPTLPVGAYKVVVEATGFKSSQVDNVVLTVAQTSNQDVKLEVGSATETVTVTASGEQLAQPAESSVSQLLSRSVWENYPLENRDTNEFINLLPGAVPDAFAGSTRGAAVNGSRGGTGNFLVEGYDNNDQGQGGRGALVSGGITSISPEAIQEYRVITNNYAAQYGKGGGFVADTVLRGGSNDWHGSLFEYNRIQKFAANDFFSNREGIHDSLVRNQFGGSIGGPIQKDKTFFFSSVEFQRLRQGFPITATSTTQQFIDFVRTGAFTTFQETDPAGLCMQNLGAPCPGAFTNSNHLGPIFTALRSSQFFPLATRNFSNVAGGLFTTNPDIVYPVPVYGKVTVTDSSFTNVGRYTAKVDHVMSDANRFTATFLFEDSDTGDTIGGGDGAVGPPFLSPGSSILTGISWTHNFSPTLINEAKVSYLRHRRDFPQCPGTAGIPSVVTGIDPLTVGFGCTSNLPQFFTDNQFQYQDHLSLIRGNHSFKGGVEYRRIRNGSAFEAVRNGFFLPHGVEELLTDGFFGDEADLLFFGGPTYGGFTFAQASINPQNGQLPEFYRGYRANEWATYFQDDWKFRSNITLNLGLRWEYFGPPHNFRPGFDSNFFFGSSATPVPNPSVNSFFPRNNIVAAQVANGGFKLTDHNIWRKDYNNFAPRVGIAWDVFGDQKLVLRGGGGMFYDRIWNNLFENIRFNAPLFSFATVGAFGNGIASGPLSTPGLYGSPFTQANRAGFNNPAFNPAPSPRHMDERLKTPYNQQFFIGAQYEFARDFLMETNYIATAGRDLTGVIDINTFNGRGRGGSSRRINPTIAGDNFRTNAFKSIYHGFQIGVRNRPWRGLQFNSHYTLGHAIDTISDAFNSRGGLRPTDNMNINLDRGRADFDVRQRFVTGFTYEAPFFKGHKWLGGWVATGIIQVNTGAPFSVFDGSVDPNADGYFTDRAVLTGSASSVLTGGHPANGFFDPSQFSSINGLLVLEPINATTSLPTVASIQAACGVGNGQVVTTNTSLSGNPVSSRWWCNGTLGRNVFTGPGYANVDFGVHKKFAISESKSVQLQVNAFNLFNHPNFALPIRNLSDPDVGKSIATVGTPRVLQMAIRFDF
jgi:Carboxypeptidase regulatory-like domain